MTLQQLVNRRSPDSNAMTVRQALSRAPVIRLSTRLAWLDYMLGGGFVRGSVVMIHGEPGSGKSTMLAQAAGAIRGSLYISAEEAIAMVAARVVRLGLDDSMELSTVLSFDGVTAPFVVLDSLQMGDAVGLAREAVDYARRRLACVALVCHELKGGRHAGPRLLEHLCDATLRLIREPRSIVTEKNRYGAAGIALPLRMTERGLTT